MAFVLDDTAKVSSDGRGVPILAVELVVLTGPARGERVALRAGTGRVGSAAGNHLVLADRTVSRAHCELTVKRDFVTLRDLGSTNRTIVADVTITDSNASKYALSGERIDYLPRGLGYAHRNLMKERSREHLLDTIDRTQRVAQRTCIVRRLRGHATQPLGTDHCHVDGRSGYQQALISADVRGRLGTPDMLLARL